MSMHPSLRISDKDKKQRSVLKRSERLRAMMEKGKWKEGEPVYGLVKLKTLKIRLKKEKTAENAAAGGAAEGAAAPSAGGATAKGSAKEAKK